MMQVGLTALLLSAAISQTQTDVELVPPKARQGFHLGLGLRSGAMGANADPVGDMGLFQGGVFNFRFGQMANNLIGFGLSIDFGGGRSKDWVLGLGALSVLFQLAPFQKVNITFHAAVGPGFAAVQRKDKDLEQEDDPSGGYGAMYNLGATYDWFPFYDKGDSGGFSLATFVEARFFPTGDIITGGVFAGFEVAYWFGYGKNRLELEVDDAYKK